MQREEEKRQNNPKNSLPAILWLQHDHSPSQLRFSCLCQPAAQKQRPPIFPGPLKAALSNTIRSVRSDSNTGKQNPEAEHSQRNYFPVFTHIHKQNTKHRGTHRAQLIFLLLGFHIKWFFITTCCTFNSNVCRWYFGLCEQKSLLQVTERLNPLFNLMSQLLNL